MNTIKTNSIILINGKEYEIIKLNGNRFTVKNLETKKTHERIILKDKTVKLLTTEEFRGLSDDEQARYINRVTSDKFDDALKITDNGIFDTDSAELEEVTDLYDYLCELVDYDIFKREELLID